MDRPCWNAETLAGPQTHRFPAVDQTLTAVHLHAEAALGRLVVVGDPRELHENVSATPVNDVFAFGAVKMCRRPLSLGIENQLLGIGLRVS